MLPSLDDVDVKALRHLTLYEMTYMLRGHPSMRLPGGSSRQAEGDEVRPLHGHLDRAEPLVNPIRCPR